MPDTAPCLRCAALVLSDNIRGAGFMMVAMAGFTIGDACMKAIVMDMPLYQAVALRGLLTLPALAVLGHFLGGLQLRRSAGAGPMIGLRTLAEAGATLCFFAALTNMQFATLSAIMQFTPLAVTLAAALFLREPVGWRRMAAICVGLVGVLIIVRPGSEGFSIWAVLGLMCVCLVVLRDLITRRLPRDVPSITVAMFSAIGVTLLSLAISLTEPWQVLTTSSLALLLLAAACVTVGYVFAIRVMRIGEVGATAPFRYTALVWAVVLGWFFFDEWPDALTLIGAVIVVGSGVFTLLREHRLRRISPRVPPVRRQG